MQEYGVAGTQIEESIRLYRVLRNEPDPPAPLDLANALRVSALNHERQAVAAWGEAQTLYSESGVQAGTQECRDHLQHLWNAASKTSNEEQAA